jgi:hypothetical protein
VPFGWLCTCFLYGCCDPNMNLYTWIHFHLIQLLMFLAICFLPRTIMFNLNAPCNNTIFISSIQCFFSPLAWPWLDCHAMFAIVLPVLCVVSITILLPKNVHVVIWMMDKNYHIALNTLYWKNPYLHIGNIIHVLVVN